MNHDTEMGTIGMQTMDETHPRKQTMPTWLPWLMFGLGALFYSYEYLLRIMPSVMAPELMRYFGMSAASLGVFSSIYYYAYVPMQLPVGLLMDRYAPRRLLALACLTCVMGSFLIVITSSLGVATVGRFFVGFGSAFAFVGVLKIATIWLPPEKFAFFTGIASGLGTLGAISGDLLVTNLVATTGWQHSIYLAAFAGVIIMFVLWLVLRDHRPGATPQEIDAASPAHSWDEVTTIVKNPQMWINGLIGCLIYIPTTVFAEMWGPMYLENAHYFTATEAAVGISLLFAGFLVGAPIMGFISDSLRRRRPVLMMGGGASLIISCVLIYAPGLTHNVVLVLLFSLGLMYSVQAIVFVVAREISPATSAGTAIAVTNMIVMLGGNFLQPAVGKLLTLKGVGVMVDGVPIYMSQHYQYALGVVPIGIAVSIILTFFLKESAKE